MKNAFETGTQKVIPAVLLYAFRGEEVLMLNARGKDQLPGKWNGLGGKVEQGESMLQAAVREFEEEASCKTSSAQWNWLGQLHFPNFKAQKCEDWWVNVYSTVLLDEQANSIPLNDVLQVEGTLHWVRKDEVLKLDLWDGDRHFIPLVFENTPFQGTFFYENGSCVRHELALVKAANQ